jgi:hypothetical protein
MIPILGTAREAVLAVDGYSARALQAARKYFLQQISSTSLYTTNIYVSID